MQFTEALTRDERHHLARFVTSDEAELALSDEFAVVSLHATLAAGGYTEQKAELPSARMSEVIEQTRLMAMYKAAAAVGGFRELERMTETLPAVWNLPKLAVAPVRYAEAMLSDERMYTYTCGDKAWRVDFRPPWYKPFPQSSYIVRRYAAALPPLPREAQKAVATFGADKCLVLWEADWQTRDQQLLDPAILVPVWRDLYSVVYAWDLTDAERAALKKASGAA